jgi:hypothetical protein
MFWKKKVFFFLFPKTQVYNNKQNHTGKYFSVTRSLLNVSSSNFDHDHLVCCVVASSLIICNSCQLPNESLNDTTARHR